MSARMLVGDVGGTNVRFGIAARQNEQIQISDFKVFAGDACKDFYDAIEKYLAHLDTPPDTAHLAIAGPIQNDEVQLTNRNWHVSASTLRDRFDFTHVDLLNDFAAMARSIPELTKDRMLDLRPGTAEPDAPILVAGPGTGFGVATIARTEDAKWLVLQGEGGHVAFSPRIDLDVEIGNILRRKHGYVSAELVSSGSGLPAVHEAFCELFGKPYEDMAPAEMLTLAAGGHDMYLALCKLRARTVLSAAGDFVLANGARGGVVLAGGVTERLAPYFSDEDVAPYFEARGALSKYLETCPISLLTDPHAPLIGAAAYYSKA